MFRCITVLFALLVVLPFVRSCTPSVKEPAFTDITGMLDLTLKRGDTNDGIAFILEKKNVSKKTIKLQTHVIAVFITRKDVPDRDPIRIEPTEKVIPIKPGETVKRTIIFPSTDTFPLKGTYTLITVAYCTILDRNMRGFVRSNMLDIDIR
ncbi:MAG: hypothetical protein HZC28_20705 [Spirochaetes bacterium]|nr:hypothetical protein [Spirochaetota bacterium]